MIRTEQPQDFAAIGELTIQAFAESELGHHGEADLIERVRASCPNFISLVAELDQRIVGHVLFTPVTLGPLLGMGLAPLSVAPDHQRRGIGSKLVRAGLQQIHEANVPFVVVLGHPEFYARFGFRAASEFGVQCEIDDLPPGLFQVYISCDVSQFPSGVAMYRPEIWG